MPDAAAVWYWVDLNWLVQLLATALVISFALFHLLRTAASKIMIIHDHDHDQQQPHTNNNHMDMDDKCVVCGDLSTKQCSACKLVRYCSTACQRSHWKSGHKGECKDFQSFGKCNSKQGSFVQNGRKSSKGVALVPGRVHSNGIKPLREILFPYEDFLELYNWDKAGFPPCGLLNCGNSCFANVILQCLSSTRPLVAYLLEKGHQRECRRNDWCFLCELQIHIQRASTSRQPFSPLNILSRLPNIGGNLGYGKQEDAHEFMRFAIDAMQSVCLDEFGGEKVLQHSTQETTLIQHIFGGHLQSQVVCSKCCNVSNQRENMMELNVEIHGDAASLEECLDQFTAREQLHGDNMYKCDSCNDYVMAWKRLMVQRAPNILTIALKRFQSGRFGKLNKRVTFPETLDLSPYMIEQNDGNDVYKLYAVVVHVDMLNASFFGHYICYTKDFHGNWYRIDDCKVSKVDLEEVLSEGAYMLLYSRVSPRPSCLKPIGTSSKKEQQAAEVIPVEKMASEEESVESLSRAESFQSISTNSEHNDSVQMDVPLSTVSDDVAMDDTISSPSLPQDMSVSTSQDFKKDIASVSVQMDVHLSTVSDDVAMTHTIFCPSVPQDMPVSSSQDFEKDIASVSVQTDVRPSTVSNDVAMTDTISCPSVPQDMPVSSSQDFEKDIASVSVQMDVRPSIVSDDVAMTDTISSPSLPQDISVPTSQDSEKDIAFVSLQTDGLESVHLESEISSNELMSSSLDNSQCSEDVNNVPLSPTDFKRQPEKLETGNGSPSSNGGKFALKANGAKVKPFLKPGFLGKRPSNNSTKRRGKCVASNVSGFSLASTNDVHKPQPE